MANETFRVWIAGGGTGGHVIPALAVARELVDRYRAEVRFVGTARGLETRLVPAAGFPLDLIEVGQLNRVSAGTRLKTMARLPSSVRHCKRLLRSFRPHVVFGVGGYASGPAMLAAILTRTPRVAFEPNAVPGLANRMVGPWVQAAAVNFPEAQKYFRNAQVTGIPVRAEFFHLASDATRRSPRLLVFGGSQGARVLNRTMPQVAAALLQAIPGLTIVHQCGARHLEETEKAYRRAVGPAEADDAAETRNAGTRNSSAYKVQAFLDDMPQQFAAASLVLCRSGASTMAELAAAGKPSLLIPFPQAADDHQRRNAEAFLHAGAAAMLLEQEMTPERLLRELTGLLRDADRLSKMGVYAQAMAHPEAAKEIVKLLEEQKRA